LDANLVRKPSLLHRRVAAADHEQRLVAEHRQRAVAHRARRHALLPQLAVARARDGVALGGRAGGDDQGLGLALALVGRVGERTLRQIDPGDGLGVDHGAEARRLGAEPVGQLGATDALGEAGEVLDVGGGGELTAGGDAPGHPALEQDRLEVGAGGVDRGGVSGGAAADDDDG
jgi:hypothetical protein